MTTSLVVTLVGPDRPGLVSALSDKAVEFGANWADSVMSNFAGQFAGIVQLEVRPEKCDALIVALRALESPRMHVSVTKGASTAKPLSTRRLKLDLVGHDRPGIIHGISSQLAKRQISIEKLETHIASGAMSGGQMFQMKALLLVPQALDEDELRLGLESLANELMIDISLDDTKAAAD